MESYVSSTPDGKNLVLIRKADGEAKGRAVVRELPSGQERVLDTLEFSESPDEPVLVNPVLAQDGRSLLVVRWNVKQNDVRILQYSVDGTRLETKSTAYIGRDKELITRSLPSSDGATLVYGLQPGLLQPPELRRRSATGSDESSLGAGFPYAFRADGQALLIGREVKTGVMETETRLVLLDGSGLAESHVLTGSGWSVSAGVLSPDGQRAAFVAREAHPAAYQDGVQGNVFGVVVRAGDPVALVGGYAAKASIAWGIDGYIYFVSDEGGTKGVYRVRWGG